MAAAPAPAVAAPTAPSHSTAVIVGAGVSGIAALVQFKRLLKLTNVFVYEKDSQVGGTWSANVYPGASCDIPVAFYSFSFDSAKEFSTQWPGWQGLLKYYNRIVDKYQVRDRIVFRTVVDEARFSRETGLWTVKTRHVETGATHVQTCNILVSAVGALSVPADPPFDTSDFDGPVMHSARWNHNVSLQDKDVVILGNGCSAAQIVPTILPEVKSLTQIARGQQAIVPPPVIPDNAFTNALSRWIPGLFSVTRYLVFSLCESYFTYTDKVDGIAGQQKMKRESDAYLEKVANPKYKEQLKYDFPFGQKRRIIDFLKYAPATNDPKFTLVYPDTIKSAKGHTVTTEKGVEVPADVIVLSTGFKVTDYLHPLSVFNGEGESLVERLKKNGVKTYLTSMVATYPNFFLLMGPNSVTGHSSVIFNSERTVEMLVELVKPVLAALAKRDKEAEPPAPSVEIKQEVEDEWFARMRAEMEKKVWENDGGISWYVDPNIGKCTTLFPWNQLEFQRQTKEAAASEDRFIYTATATA